MHWFDYESELEVANPNGVSHTNTSPIQISFNKTENEIIIVTKSDVRILNVKTGQTLRILGDILKDTEEDGI